MSDSDSPIVPSEMDEIKAMLRVITSELSKVAKLCATTADW